MMSSAARAVPSELMWVALQGSGLARVTDYHLPPRFKLFFFFRNVNRLKRVETLRSLTISSILGILRW